MTTYGLWLGVATPAAFGADDPEPYGVGLLVGGPLGLLSGLRIARARGISEGQARAITFGGTWGTWQGLGWAQVLDLDGLECNGDVCTNNSAEETFAAMIGGGLAGILAGAIIAAKPVASGTASTVSFGALWGTWFGVATGVIADLEDDDLLLATLVGGDAGLLTTALLAPHWKLSRNRARLISISGVIGGLAGAGIDLIAQPDADETVIGIPLATSIAGLIAGTILTRDYDLTHAPGGEDAGALFTMDNGRFRMGTPQPLPVLEPVRRDGRTRFRPAARLTLLRATF
jgi:hypothetical protein